MGFVDDWHSKIAKINIRENNELLRLSDVVPWHELIDVAQDIHPGGQNLLYQRSWFNETIYRFNLRRRKKSWWEISSFKNKDQGSYEESDLLGSKFTSFCKRSGAKSLQTYRSAPGSSINAEIKIFWKKSRSPPQLLKPLTPDWKISAPSL